MATNSECAAACDSNSGCGAYDRPDLGGSQECCLFMVGNVGNGEAGNGEADHACMLKLAATATSTTEGEDDDTTTLTTTDGASTPAPSANPTREETSELTSSPTTSPTSAPTASPTTSPMAVPPGYRRTEGFCRSGPSWPDSGEVWDCSVGMATNSECAAACDSNGECGAYDRPDLDGSQECCLFKVGNVGNGKAGNGEPDHACMLKQERP